MNDIMISLWWYLFESGKTAHWTGYKMIYVIGDYLSYLNCRTLEKVRAVIVIKLFTYFFQSVPLFKWSIWHMAKKPVKTFQKRCFVCCYSFVGHSVYQSVNLSFYKFFSFSPCLPRSIRLQPIIQSPNQLPSHPACHVVSHDQSLRYSVSHSVIKPVSQPTSQPVSQPVS